MTEQVNFVSDDPAIWIHPGGLFIAMSDNKTYHYYSWTDIAGDELRIRGR